MTRVEHRQKTIFGPERWKEIAGVTFVYWDRWLLRLALDEPDGVEGLVRPRCSIHQGAVSKPGRFAATGNGSRSPPPASSAS